LTRYTSGEFDGADVVGLDAAEAATVSIVAVARAARVDFRIAMTFDVLLWTTSVSIYVYYFPGQGNSLSPSY
jgi:hypothetical protein